MSAADDGIPSQQVDQLLGSSKLALALESDRYKHLLDHAPVAVAVSRGSGESSMSCTSTRRSSI
jgi:hypothetical protein